MLMNREIEKTDKKDKMMEEHNKINQEKEAICEQNKELKFTILKMLYNIQIYENQESIRLLEINVILLKFIIFQKCHSQILKENDYLRKICSNVIGNSQTNLNIPNSQNTRNIDLGSPHYDNKRGLHRRQETKINNNCNITTLEETTKKVKFININYRMLIYLN